VPADNNLGFLICEVQAINTLNYRYPLYPVHFNKSEYVAQIKFIIPLVQGNIDYADYLLYTCGDLGFLNFQHPCKNENNTLFEGLKCALTNYKWRRKR
jgi:hypothetical protein